MVGRGAAAPAAKRLGCRFERDISVALPRTKKNLDSL